MVPLSLPPMDSFTGLAFWNDGRLAQGRSGGVLWFFYRKSGVPSGYVGYHLENHPDAYFGDDSCEIGGLDEAHWLALSREVARRSELPTAPLVQWPDMAGRDNRDSNQSAPDTGNPITTNIQAAAVLGISKSHLANLIGDLRPEDHQPPAATVIGAPDAKRIRRRWDRQEITGWMGAALHKRTTSDEHAKVCKDGRPEPDALDLLMIETRAQKG